MAEPRIRPATAGDLPRLVALNRAEVPAVGAVTDEQLWWLVDHAWYAPVVEEDGQVQAFLIGLGPGLDYASPNYRWFAARYDDFAYVDRVVVGADHRRRGWAGRLYDAFADAVAGAASVMTCEVNVDPPNPGSMAFHAARGFEKVGEQDTYEGTARVALLVTRLSR
jgi:uncharacterized protein